MARLYLVALVLLSSWYAAKAEDMSFKLQERDLRPNFDLDQWIFANGEIVPGTTGRFLGFVKANPQLTDGATVILNSPGGSPIEGIKLGDAIRQLRYRTDVGAEDPTPMTVAQGLCLSACIYPYLGGEYRYLKEGSVIGIHRFRFSKDFGGDITSEISQQLSGEIVSFIARSRADPRLFAVMSHTPPDDVQVLSSEDLKKFKIVTRDIYSEDWGFEVHGPLSYLKADQITSRGENKLIFGCAPVDGRLTTLVTVLSELRGRQSVVDSAQNVLLFIDEQVLPVPANLVAGQPRLEGTKYIGWSIKLTADLVGALKNANEIGSGLSIAPGIFAGFQGIGLGDGKDKLIRYLNDCSDKLSAASTENAAPSNAAPTAVATAPTAPGPLPNSTSDATDLVRRVARNFDQQFKKAGMAGLKVSVETCYARARQALKEAIAQYCYLLDELASSVDAAVMQKLNIRQDDYWQSQSVLARTSEVLKLIKSDPVEHMQTLRYWMTLRALALKELLVLREHTSQQ
jgi:hypothetical protein